MERGTFGEHVYGGRGTGGEEEHIEKDEIGRIKKDIGTVEEGKGNYVGGGGVTGSLLCIQGGGVTL